MIKKPKYKLIDAISAILSHVMLVLYPIILLVILKLIFQKSDLLEVMSSSNMAFVLMTFQIGTLMRYMKYSADKSDFSKLFYSMIYGSIFFLIYFTVVFVMVILHEIDVIQLKEVLMNVIGIINGLLISIQIFVVISLEQQVGILQRALSGYGPLPALPVSRIKLFHTQLAKIKRSNHYLLRIMKDRKYYQSSKDYFERKGFEIDQELDRLNYEIDACISVLQEMKPNLEENRKLIKSISTQ